MSTVQHRYAKLPKQLSQMQLSLNKILDKTIKISEKNGIHSYVKSMLTSCELLFGRCEWNAWCNDSMGSSRVYRFGLALCLIGNGSHLESYERYCIWVLHGGCDTLFCVRLFIVVFAMFIWKSALPPFVIIFCVRAMTECYLCNVVRLLCMQYVARSPFL